MTPFNNRLIYVLLALFIISWALSSLYTILIPFIVSFIGAYAFNPSVTWMEKRRIPRGLGGAFIVLSLIVLLTLLLLIALPYLQKKLILFANSIPTLTENFFAKLAPLLDSLSQGTSAADLESLKRELTAHVGDVLSWTVTFLRNLVGNSIVLANVLSLVLLTPVVMFYLIKDWPRVIKTLDQLLPQAYAVKIRSYARSVDKTLSAYARGQAMVCFILMVLYATVLSLVGLQQGVLVGIAAGFLSFIPYVGAIIGFLACMGVSFTQYADWASIGIVAASFLSVATFDGYFLTPRFIGERVGLNPVWIIFSLLAAGVWFGFIGILFAMPVTGAIGAIVKKLIKEYKNSSFYQYPATAVLKKRPRTAPGKKS